MAYENIPFHCTDELGNISFAELTRREDYEINNSSLLVHQPYSVYVGLWEKFLTDLTVYDEEKNDK